MGGGAVVLLCAGLLLWSRQACDVEALRAWRDEAPAVPFFLAQALLPLIGVPTTPFFVLAGASFGAFTAVAGSLAGVALNLAMSYWIAHSGLKPVLLRLLARGRHRIPALNPRHGLRLTVAVRLFPAMPNFVKNYALCLAGIPFWMFFGVSMVTSSLYALSFVFLGESIFNPDVLTLLLALGVLLLLGVLARLVERRVTAHDAPQDEPQRGPSKSGGPFSP